MVRRHAVERVRDGIPVKKVANLFGYSKHAVRAWMKFHTAGDFEAVDLTDGSCVSRRDRYLVTFAPTWIQNTKATSESI